jgi:pimeloyl-ACP methyl ester carboxylesterase
MSDVARAEVVDADWTWALMQARHHRDGSPVFSAKTGAPDAEPIILLHGIGNNGAIYAPLLPRLAELGPVFAPTMSSQLLADADQERPGAFATLIDWLSALAPPPWRLVGHSMGGVLVGLILRARPDVVSSAVLLNAPLPSATRRLRDGAGLDRVGRAIVAMRALARVSSLGRPRLPGVLRGAELGLVRTALRGFVVDPDRLDDDVLSTAIVASRTRDGLEFLELAHELPVWADEPHDERPVRVVLGDRDPLVPLGDLDAIREQYPAAAIEVLERCGHFAHLEHTEATLDLITPFHGGRTGEPGPGR